MLSRDHGRNLLATEVPHRVVVCTYCGIAETLEDYLIFRRGVYWHESCWDAFLDEGDSGT